MQEQLVQASARFSLKPVSNFQTVNLWGRHVFKNVVKSALILIFLSEHAVAFQQRPPSWNEYSKFPDPLNFNKNVSAETRIRLQNFQQYLNNINTFSSTLRENCVDPAGAKMTAVVKGVRVLVWPERYDECQKAADYLSKSVLGYGQILAKLNTEFGSNYTLPLGDPRIIAEWNNTKELITAFPTKSCNAASRTMVYAGSNERKKLYEELKSHCPGRWASIFSEGDPSSEKKKQKDLLCEKARQDGLNGIILDGSTVECDSRTELATHPKASDLERDLEKIKMKQRGSGELTLDDDDKARISQRKPGQYAAHVKDSYEDFVSKGRQADKSGFKQVEDALSQAAAESRARATDPRSLSRSMVKGSDTPASGCDPDFHSKISAELEAAMDSPAVKNAPLSRQQCVMARATIPTYQKMLAYTQRCQPGSATESEIRKALSGLRQQENTGCASAQ